MRAAVVLCLCLLVLAAVPAAGHEGGVHHGEIFRGSLVPGQGLEREVEFEGGDLVGGWVFLLVARVQGGPLSAELSIASETVATWSIPPSDRWFDTLVLPTTGAYLLTLENRGLSDVTFALYFDQSCNCVGKAVPHPTDIPNGLVIFNVDAHGPGEVVAELYGPKAMRVRVTAALLQSSGGNWPNDFVPLASTETPEYRQASSSLPPVPVYVLRANVETAARVYYFVEALAFDPANYTTALDLAITPEYRVPSAPSFPWTYVGVAAVMIGIGALVLWRGRRAPARETVTPRGGRGGRRTRTSRSRRR